MKSVHCDIIFNRDPGQTFAKVCKKVKLNPRFISFKGHDAVLAKIKKQKKNQKTKPKNKNKNNTEQIKKILIITCRIIVQEVLKHNFVQRVEEGILIIYMYIYLCKFDCAVNNMH